MRKLTEILTVLAVVAAGNAGADTVINNYGSNSQPQTQQQTQPQSASTNNGPPAGAYSTTNSDGSSEQLYTTGSKQPYYVDNPNTQTQVPPVYVQPTIPTPSPAPRTNR